jgi:alanine dehydrogenase
MIIGVPKEIKDQEYRVALPPSAGYIACETIEVKPVFG